MEFMCNIYINVLQQQEHVLTCTKGMSSMRLKTYIQSVVSLVQCLTEELHGFSDTVTMIT